MPYLRLSVYSILVYTVTILYEHKKSPPYTAANS